jgi:hypothetical protein
MVWPTAVAVSAEAGVESAEVEFSSLEEAKIELKPFGTLFSIPRMVFSVLEIARGAGAERGKQGKSK